MSGKLDQEYSYAYSGPKPVDIVPAVRRGVQAWAPDMAMFAGNLVDAPLWALKKIFQGQKQQTIPSAGIGAALAQKVAAKLGNPPRSQTELRDPNHTEPGAEGVEELVRLANPLAFMSPGNAIKGMSMALGAPEMGGALGIVKQKGGNWLNGSVENALKGLKRPMFEQADLTDPDLWREAEMVKEHGPINSWIEGPLTKYVKTRMATPEDEVRKLAEQGLLHFDPQWGLTDRVVDARKASGFPVEGISKSEPAIKWEAMADRAVLSEPAETYQNFGSSNLGVDWINKLDPKTPFYRLKDQYISGDLGFPHLIDELSNALNPASGLPRHLQLSPEAMQNLSMEKAIRRVHDINAWRAAQKVEANRLLAQSDVNTPIRDYVENNPKGLRWVELGRDEESQPDFFKSADDYRKALADQLKYEGDTMGHCVGGYCDDVLSGRSRIFSLRDAKGEPHVTVEVKPNIDKPGFTDVEEMFVDDMGRPPRSPMELDDWAFNQGIEMNDAMETAAGGGFKIHQIKGKQNRAPSEEYLPFVQDFVRNSPLGVAWDDVGDLSNAGLRTGNPNLLGRNIPLPEDALKQLPRYYTLDELGSLLKARGTKYSEGGQVWPFKTHLVN